MIHPRRQFINTIGLSTVYSLLFDRHFFQDPVYRPHSIGVLLGTVEQLMLNNAPEILARISKTGFTELEYPGTYGQSPTYLAGVIKENNLFSLGGGDTRHNLTRNFDLIVKEYNRLGKKYVFCYWPWLDGGLNKSLDDWKMNADTFNKLGKAFKQEGLRLAYHNHDIEFKETEGKCPYEILLSGTDQELITFEMDIWWIKKGGCDPLLFIDKYPGRFEVCHIKPYGLLNNNEEVQNLNYKPVVEQLAKKGNCRHFILENEPHIADPVTYLEKGYIYIDKL